MGGVAHRANVTKGADVAAMIEACALARGRVDVLDNNAGVAEVGRAVLVLAPGCAPANLAV